MDICIEKIQDIKVGIEFIFDCDKGILIDLSKCINNENLTISKVRYLCDNVTTMKEKNNDYYIDNLKYLDKYTTEKYQDEIFAELGRGLIKGRTYLCLEHQGKYIDRKKTYKKLLEYIKSNNYKISGIPVEQYIVGSWNEIDEEKFITNIMIPIEIDL